MKKSITCFLVFILSIIFTFGSLAAGFTDNSEEIEKATKSVLMLFVYRSEYDEVTDFFATGSGFVAFNSSLLVTNYHVIEGGARILALDDDNNAYELDKVICADENYDIAILEFDKPTKLTPFDLYADDHINRGSPVIAIGSPYGGEKNTVTKGIVSSQYERSDGRPEIQFTAQISSGNSGGVLLNDNGKVIGIPTESFVDGQNLNFAVNISVAIAMYNAWDGKKYSLKNYKTSAKMDFNGVYKHDTQTTQAPETESQSSIESWICTNCGQENTTKFCQNCGTRKTYWICSCGKENADNKFCGECGKSIFDLIDSFNSAIEKAAHNDYSGALDILKDLGQFNSGSFETDAGANAYAQEYINKINNEQGKEIDNAIPNNVTNYSIPVSAAQINNNFSLFSGNTVKLNGLKIYDWAVVTPSNSIKHGKQAKLLAQNSTGYSLHILCYSGDYYIDVVLIDYYDWGWNNHTDDLLGMIGKIKSLSIEGVVQPNLVSWRNMYTESQIIYGVYKNTSSIPSITINSIDWQ